MYGCVLGLNWGSIMGYNYLLNSKFSNWKQKHLTFMGKTYYSNPLHSSTRNYLLLKRWERCILNRFKLNRVVWWQPRLPLATTRKIFLLGFQNFNCIFFFHFFCSHILFFFSQEKFKIHSLTQIQRAGKKNTAPEKKNNIFTHSLDFWPKMAKV